jgi:hypothetical protein
MRGPTKRERGKDIIVKTGTEAHTEQKDSLNIADLESAWGVALEKCSVHLNVCQCKNVILKQGSILRRLYSSFLLWEI